MAIVAANTICTATAPLVLGAFYPNPAGRWGANGSCRLLIFAKDLIWAFYRSCLTDATAYIYFRTSSDGTTWSGATQVRSQPQETSNDLGSCFCVAYDPVADKIHYAFSSNRDNDAIFYRMGTPQTNGTISWAAAEQTAVAAGGVGVVHTCCHIDLDTDGYPWIGYNADAPNHVLVTKSSTKNGTWTTQGGFPYNFGALVGCNRPVICPLTNGKVYVCWSRGAPGGVLEGQLWDGAAWDAGGVETICADTTFYVDRIGAVAEGDDVHFVYLELAALDILYRKRTYGVGWSGATTLAAAVPNQAQPLITRNLGTNEIYVVWENGDIIFYNLYSNGAWGGAIQWIDETVDDVEERSCRLSPPGLWLWCGVIYASKLISPFNVRFAALAMKYAHSVSSP